MSFDHNHSKMTEPFPPTQQAIHVHLNARGLNGEASIPILFIAHATPPYMMGVSNLMVGGAETTAPSFPSGVKGGNYQRTGDITHTCRISGGYYLSPCRMGHSLEVQFSPRKPSLVIIFCHPHYTCSSTNSSVIFTLP